ncbi:MAG TPA: flavin reductase family protein [Bacteroidetes bacterium]|nr:flavin reductase family protein [Bacteroidota bacterium]
MKQISPDKFIPRIHHLWKDQWFLLTSGDFEKGDFNTMTVAWGFFGIMWSRPVAAVVVRPTRYTFGFMNRYDTFTLTAFNDKYKKDLNLLGTKSGRDGDKIAETRLTPVRSTVVAAPAFKEAELIVECKKMYWDDFKPEHFLNPYIETKYPKKDYHRMYFGEVVHIIGEKKYQTD